ncbi:hypothetical protein QYE76_001412 [Lolium multiflorum]|uniref:Retrotransposon gag domain-containing protein n=1 Tax=Lolium multiflorum TaxID=4521 RepID=A0AAD8RM07_LOLMU|nr:hypothetical protein QYE76_001412 [Lolium multiflorum]
MGKPRDTKIAILPSTTRKGTTLSTSAALDSPSVIDKLVSPPHASRAGTSAESENSHNIDNVSAVLDDSGSLGSFLDATIAKSRQIENTETPNATTPVKSPELEYSSDDLDEDYVELDDDFIEKCNATTDARKIKKLLAEHAVRYKPSPDPKFATSPINIRDKDYDFSLDLSHIAIVEKTPFCGTEKESAVEHLTELSTLSGVFSDDVKMRTYFVAKIFPFSLKDDAKTWYNNLPPGSIKSPTDLRDVFFRKYFPASAQHAALQRIYNFDQEDGEKLPEAWARFCSLIRAQPDHDLEKHDLLDIFYSGLTIESRAYLDSCAGCVFRKRTPEDAEELLAKIGRNHDDWSTPEPTPTPIVKKRGMIKLNDEDMREAKKSLKEKGIKPEDVKNLPPIEDICETIPPSSMIEDPLYPEGHPKRVEQDSQLIKTSAPSKKKKKKHKNVVESSEPVNDPNSISISDAETESGNEHEEDNDKNDTPDKEEIEKEPEKHAKNKKYTKEDFITEKHGAVIDCNKGMVTFNVDDKEHTVYFPKRIDKKGKMKKFKFGELFKKATTSTGRPSRASTQIRRSYNEDVIAPSFAPEEDHGAPNASSFPCYEFLTNAGILDDFFTLVNRAGLATYVGDERGQYYRLTKVFVESFKFHNTEYEPTVAFKIYDIPVTMKLEEFCCALGIAPVGTARRIDDNPRDLLELYRGITGDDCRTIQRGKIRNIQLPAIKYFAYYIGTSILGRENTSNISSYHLAFLNVALTGETPYHLGSLIARRLSSRGPIFGGTIALRILTHLDIPLDSNDVPLTPRKLDIAAMKSHRFVTTDSTIDNMVYRMLFADGNEKEIPLPQQGLFNIDRQSWSLTKEVVEEHMKIQEFHQQHDSENAEPSYDYTKGKMKKFKFGELFKKATTSTGRPSRASTQIRRSYNEDVIAPSFAPEEDHGAPNASSFPCYEFLTNAGILDDFFTLVNRAGLATYVGDERGQYYRLTKVFVESFKFHNTEYEPTVAFKIYDIPVTMKLEEFCCALGIAPVGTARRIDDNPRDLLELYRGITGDDCRTIQRGKIRNIQLPAIKYFAYYIGTSILGRENTSNISSYHLAFLNVALTGETPYHLGSLIARRLSSRGPIFGGTIALRILTHLDIPLDSNDVPLTPRKLDIAAMKSHRFVTTDSTIDNMVYKMLFADGNEKEIPLPQQGLFNIDRQSWSLTKEVVEEHMKIQEFHQQHDSENAEPSYDYTVTYPDVSSSTYMEPGRSSSYYEDTTSWGPWE